MNATSSRRSTVSAALVRKAAFRSRQALGLVAAAVAGLLALRLRPARRAAAASAA
jgi:hypothetical protein